MRAPWRLGAAAVAWACLALGTGPLDAQDVAAGASRSEEVRYPNAAAGIELAGTLTLPAGNGPFPAVVLISGSGPHDRDSRIAGRPLFRVLAEHLARRGVAALRSDDRGVGGSGGSFGDATTENFATDAAAAAAFLRSRPEIRPSRVGLIGHSEGGLVAPLTATRVDSIAFLVLLAGPGVPGEQVLYTQSALIAQAMGLPLEQVEYNRVLQQELFTVIKAEADGDLRHREMERVLRAQFERVSDEERAALDITPTVVDEWVASQVAEMGGPWFRYFLRHDPRPVLRDLEVPVLALNGGLDLQVPATPNLAEIDAALAAGDNVDATVMELPGLNHLFQTAATGLPAEYGELEETMSPVAMDVVADWILERTGRP